MRLTQKLICALCAAAVCGACCIVAFRNGLFYGALCRRDIQSILSLQMHVSADAAANADIERRTDGLSPRYLVTFFANGCRYTVLMDARSGEILDKDIVLTEENQTDGTMLHAPAVSEILPRQEAMELALRHAGCTAESAAFSQEELYFSNGLWYYDFCFTVSEFSYEYRVHAITGEILYFHTDGME